MKIKYIILISFLLNHLHAYSQIDYYVDGFVILESKDTIIGKVKFLNKEDSCFKIKFKNQKGKKVKLKEREVHAYKRGDDYYVKKSYVRPVTISNMTGYMKLINDGKIKLYQFNYIIYRTEKYMSSYKVDYYLERNNVLNLRGLQLNCNQHLLSILLQKHYLH